MLEPIQVVWTLLRTVSDRCEELAWSSSDEAAPNKPDNWNKRHAQLEYRIFGIFLLSHAMTHFKHDLDARDRAIFFCMDALADEFSDVEVEGDDYEAIAASRFDKYGRIEGGNETNSWAESLDYYLAASAGKPIALEPDITIGDFTERMRTKLHLINCIDKLFIRAFYLQIVKVCQDYDDIFAMTIPELEASLGISPARDTNHNPRKDGGLLRRFFRKGPG